MVGAYSAATSHGIEDLGNHVCKCGAGVAMSPLIMVNSRLLNQRMKGDLRCKINLRNGGIRRAMTETTYMRVLKLIRWANLDAFWAHEPSTVRGNLAACRQGADIAALLGLKAKLFRPLGPFPLNDTFGMAAAIVMLQASLCPGKYDKCIQFGTVQKLRSGFSNAYHVTAEGQEAVVMAKDT
jgi:hypothetical protein